MILYNFMNKDIFYAKYLKYKTKYNNLKNMNMAGGSGDKRDISRGPPVRSPSPLRLFQNPTELHRSPSQRSISSQHSTSSTRRSSTGS